MHQQVSRSQKLRQVGLPCSVQPPQHTDFHIDLNPGQPATLLMLASWVSAPAEGFAEGGGQAKL